MQKPNDLNQSRIVLKQDSTRAVLEAAIRSEADLVELRPHEYLGALPWLSHPSSMSRFSL